MYIAIFTTRRIAYKMQTIWFLGTIISLKISVKQNILTKNPYTNTIKLEFYNHSQSKMCVTKKKWFHHCENLFKMTKHDINNIIWCIKFEFDFIHQDKWNVNVLIRSTFDMLTKFFENIE